MSGDDQRSERIREYIAVALLTGLALALRLHNLGLQSLWLDEAYTYERAALPLPDTVARTIARHHVPTYFVFMHYFIRLGDDEFMLRLPSAIFGALTVLSAYALGRAFGGARCGLLTAFVVAVTPAHIRYSQEARMYSMMTFTTATALAGLAWLGANLDRACAPILGWRRIFPSVARSAGAITRHARWAWAAYVGGTVATLYLHNLGVFLGATSVVGATALWLAARGRRTAFALNFVTANAVVVAAWTPYLGTLLRQTQKLSHGYWADPPTKDAVVKVACDLYALGSRDPDVHAVLGGFAVLSLVALVQRPHLSFLLLVAAIGAPAAALILSQHTPVFILRLVLWALVPGAVLLCAWTAALRSAVPVVLAALAVAWVARPGLHVILETQYKTPWREAAVLIRQRAEQPAVVLAPQRQPEVLMRYYFHRKKLPRGNLPVVRAPLRLLLRATHGARHVFVIDTRRKGNAAPYVAALTRRGRGRLSWHTLLGRKLDIYKIEMAGR